MMLSYPNQQTPYTGATSYPAYTTGYFPAAPSQTGPVILMNGMQAYTQSIPSQARSHLTLRIPMSAGHSAAALMLEDLLTQGSEATKAKRDAWERQGIKLHVLSDGDKLKVAVQGPNGQEALMMQAALDLLTRPQVDEPTYRRLKEDQLQNLKNECSDPEYPAIEAIGHAMYPKHPYGLSTNDRRQQLEKQNLGDVMQILHHTLGFPELTQVSLISSRPVAEQQQLLNDTVGQFLWFPQPNRQGQPYVTPTIAPKQGSEAPLFVPQENLKHARIIHSWRAPAVNDPDYPAFCILKETLGGMSGGFFRVLRTEQGLVYGTANYYNPHKGIADYSASIQVDYDKIDQGLKAIQKVVMQASTQDPTATDLQMAKSRLRLQLRSQQQNAMEIAQYQNKWLRADLTPPSPDAFLQALERVSPQDVQRVASRVFSPDSRHQVSVVSAPKAVLEQFSQSSTSFQGMPRAIHPASTTLLGR